MAKLEVEILGDSRSLEKAFARSSKSAKDFNKDMGKAGEKSRGAFSGLGKTLGLVTGGLGVAGLAGAAHAAFSEMEDSQKVAAQTAAVLKSTGGAANVSAKQIDAMAQSLLQKSGVDDETIKSGENLLLTFTNVRNEVGKGNDIFDQATKTMLDMSTALGQDTKSSAIQLGKALNDPIKGITALRRVGVSFSADQIKLIKHLTETGHTMAAQKLILAELNKEFGGSAAAAGKTLPGQLNILTESLRNLGGDIAQKLAPTITNLVARMTKWLNNSKNQKTIMDTLTTVVKTAATGLKILKGAFDVLSKAVGGNKHAIELLIAAYATWKIAGLIGNVATLAGKFGLLAKSEGAAAGASRRLSASMLGKAGLVAGVGVASYEITKMILHLTGLDKKLGEVGGAAYGFASKLGLVKGAPAKIEGGSSTTIRSLRAEAVRLEAGGLTASQAAARLAAAHPNAARHDVDVAAGLYGRSPAIVVHGGVHLHGVHDVAGMENEIAKRAKARPTIRRGSRG